MEEGSENDCGQTTQTTSCMSKPIVLDLETKHSFREVNNDLTLLGVTCVGIYNYADDSYYAYMEGEIPKALRVIEAASFTIGFNIDHFDFPVLNPYYTADLSKLPTIDLLTEFKNSLGKRVSLDSIAMATLGTGKSGHGLQAIEFYREGKLEELKRYCLDDVKITKDLYDYGIAHNEVFISNWQGKLSVKVDWGKKQVSSQVNLTLGI